ncbi:hypothetical protein Bca4012_043508 [Brassica carinata]|uniref:Uncharacterized protein n=2 Tax=Brassica TaxID=3705 RepID=A0A8X7QTH7_BRACI|nr:hypothetical protein Bca52824_058833 [Brassica carinata]CAF1740667.1 unnamed protein product [Brassica napus]
MEYLQIWRLIEKEECKWNQGSEPYTLRFQFSAMVEIDRERRSFADETVVKSVGDRRLHGGRVEQDCVLFWKRTDTWGHLDFSSIGLQFMFIMSFGPLMY